MKQREPDVVYHDVLIMRSGKRDRYLRDDLNLRPFMKVATSHRAGVSCADKN